MKKYLFLIVLIILAYGNSLNNGFVSDDIAGIVQNTSIQHLSSVFQNPILFLRPLIYFLIYKSAGLNPLFFRLVNITFHILTTLMVYKVVARVTKKTRVALLSAIIFGIHPLVVESVTWISGGSYPQYALFVLLSFYYYLKKNHWFSFFLFCIALLFSEKAIVFPILVCTYNYSFSKKIISKQLIGYGVVALFFGLILITGIAPRISAFQTIYSESHPYINPIIQIPYALTKYVELFIFPYTLSLYHTDPFISYVEYGVRFLFFCIGLVITIASFFKKKHIFFWMVFFVVALAPTLLPIGITWIVAERYAYLSLVALSTLFALGCDHFISMKRTRIIAYVICTLFVTSMFARTVIRNMDWKDQDTLFLSLEKTAPLDPKTHNNLGDVYIRRNNFDRAIAEFKRAIELNPQYAAAHHNLAVTYQQMGRHDDAIISYQRAVQFNPGLWQSYQNMASIYFAQKRYGQAEDAMKKAIEALPNDSTLLTKLGIVYLKMGKKGEAKKIFTHVLELDPQNVNALQGLILTK